MAMTPTLSRPTGTFQGVGTTINIHSDHIGFVCGMRFKTLSEIGRATHTRIHVSNDGGAEFKTITVGGRSVQDVTVAYTRLMQVAREAEVRTPRVGSMPSSMTALNIAPLHGIEYRVEIHKEDVGMVLGGKGSTLRKIGTETWTWAKFFKATETTGPMFSIRGFLSQDVETAVGRLLSIAQESYNRRTGGTRHYRQPRAHEPMTMADKAVFTMAPVPAPKRVGFKVKCVTSPADNSTSPHTPPSA